MNICLKSTKDVVVDLMIDNLFDEEFLNASQLGEVAREIQGCINSPGTKLTKDTIKKYRCCIYVVDESGNYVCTETTFNYDVEKELDFLYELDQK